MLRVAGLAGLVLGFVAACAASGADTGGSTTGWGGSIENTGGQGGATTTSSTTTTSDGGEGGTTSTTTSGGGEGGQGGMKMPGLPMGAECKQDGDCESNLCKKVLLDSDIGVCVIDCTQQSDCAVGGANYFCEAIKAGDPNGYCIPRSPAHCLSCDMDADCGSLAEVCFVAPGDEDKACHVDCAIGGEDACPPEYTCESIDVSGTMRKLCRPNVATCLDAEGGYCDRIQLPQSCKRKNAAGECLGKRECMDPSKRYSACNAMAPQCKASCDTQDPAGCNLGFCKSATSQVDNCGACGNACPGLGKTAVNVTCDANQSCTFSCQGENYDVNGNPADGCEKGDAPTGNHAQNTALYLGKLPCTDGSSNPNISGSLPSDARVHENPAVSGFSASTGSAPDFYRIYADGGFCQNEIVLNLQVSGSANPTCYKLTAVSNKTNVSCTTNGNGSCGVNQGSSAYSDNTDIFITVEKTCGNNVSEAPTYTVTGHL